jgi:hypothetical protein
MFKSVIILHESQDALPNPPNQNDLSEVLNMLNLGVFKARIAPDSTIKNVLESFWFQDSDLRVPVCHTISRKMANYFSNIRKVSGYLLKNNMEITKLNNIQTKFPPDFVHESRNGNFGICLRHHSVIMDSQGNYIECLPPDFEPIDQVMFLPHDSGSLGYNLLAELN